MGAVLKGWGLAEHGDSEFGITQMREGIDAFRATGYKIVVPYFLALLAEQVAKAGDIEQGLALLAEGIVQVNDTGQRWCEVELYRRKGELLRMQGRNLAEAENAFFDALRVAQSQTAKLLELRVTMSLARLWRGSAKQPEGRRLLAEAYAWFTEGLETPNLQDARVLLETL